jgi:hypothetical protein
MGGEEGAHLVGVVPRANRVDPDIERHVTPLRFALRSEGGRSVNVTFLDMTRHAAEVEELLRRIAKLARIRNQQVRGSSPRAGSTSL